MISKDQLKTIIVDSQKMTLPKMWKRDLQIPLESGKIITLSGVRRSGKTFHLFNVMHQLKKQGVPEDRMLYINFEDERLHLTVEELDLILQAYQELYPDIILADCYLFFDEIQEILGWEKFIARVYASVTKHVFITGSNARLLSKEIATSLRGRTITFEIYPLSFSEYAQVLSPGINIHGSKNRAHIARLFSKFMREGGFPEIIKLEAELKEKVLQEYFNVMVFRDIVDRYQISNSIVLKYFCKRAIGASAGEFSVNKIYNELKSQGYQISKDTLYLYQGYIDAIYLNRFISKHSYSVVKSESSLKKIFVIDQGLGAALDYKLAQDESRLLETTVALELLKAEKHIVYQKNGSECDFIILNKGTAEEAIQVTTSLEDPKTREREIKGLVNTCIQYSLNKGTIITLDHAEEIVLNGVAISVIPAWRYFYQYSG